MSTPSSSSRPSRGKSGTGAHSRHHRVIPISTSSSSRLVHSTSDSVSNLDLPGPGFGTVNRSSDSSTVETLQTPPDMDSGRAHETLIYSFNESPPSRPPFHSYGQPSGSEKVHSGGHYDQQYLSENLPPQSMGGPSYDRSSTVQSTSSGTNSPLANIHNMQPVRPPHYSIPIASNSQEHIDDEFQMLLTSTSDTPPFPFSHSFEHGGSPSTDPNALHSDSETHGLSHHAGDGHAPKSGYRREIEAKSRNKIRLASQRLRNVISPNMRPGVSLRGAADVMEEAADQIRRLSERMRDMETQIRLLRSQLSTRQQPAYDARMIH